VDGHDERLRIALRDVYAYFRENEAMLANVARDAALVPALAEVLRRGRGPGHREAMRDALMAGRGARGSRRRRVRAAIALALALPTWQRLTGEEGLSDAEAVALMVAAVGAA
jgi:hypothetical protein